MLGKLIATLIFRTVDKDLVYFEVFENYKNQEHIDYLVSRYELVSLLVTN